MNADGNNYLDRNLQQPESEQDTFTVERYRQFAARLPSAANVVLDIGCNTGRGGLELKRLRPKASLVGLDVVQERLDRLPAGVYDRRICGSATQIPLEDECVDGVVAGEFIEHLYPRDVYGTLCEIFRVLKLNGVCLLTTPNPGDLKRLITGKTVLGGAHLTQHHPSILKSRLMAVGFTKVRIYGTGKVSNYLGTRVPLLGIYGSYMISAVKW